MFSELPRSLILNSNPQAASASYQRGGTEAVRGSWRAWFDGKSAGGMPDTADDDDTFDDLSVDSFLGDPDDDNDEVVGTETFETDDAEDDEGESGDDDDDGG